MTLVVSCFVSSHPFDLSIQAFLSVCNVMFICVTITCSDLTSCLIL